MSSNERAITHYDELAASPPVIEGERSWHLADLGVTAAQIATVPAEVHAELEARERAAEKHARFMADLMADSGDREELAALRAKLTGDDHRDDRDDGWPVGSVEC